MTHCGMHALGHSHAGIPHGIMQEINTRILFIISDNENVHIIIESRMIINESEERMVQHY